MTYIVISGGEPNGYTVPAGDDLSITNTGSVGGVGVEAMSTMGATTAAAAGRAPEAWRAPLLALISPRVQMA